MIVRRTLGEYSTEVVIDEGMSPPQEYIDQVVEESLNDAHRWFEEQDAMYPPRDLPLYHFLVVGGRFVGSELTSDGTFSVAGDDPGATAFDWLLAA